MKTRVAINGFGRIGRAFYKIAKDNPELEIVAVNDLGDIANLAYLLQFDSVYGRSQFTVTFKTDPKPVLVINGVQEVAVVSEKDPTKLPWKDMNIDIVVESTGLFTSYEKSKVHLDAGAKKVVITAPVKDDPPAGMSGATILMGINEDGFSGTTITSNASCTTNAASPLIQILHEGVGIERAILSTVHAYTASQSIVDGPNKKDFREGRAAAQNIVPSTTGAAIAVTKAIPDLTGKFDGLSFRVPVVAGSIADITFVSKRATTVEELNGLLKKAAADTRWSKVFTVTEEDIVSSDILGSPFASIADLSFTKVVDGTLCKVLAWYDNEMGYTYALVEHVVAAAKAM